MAEGQTDGQTDGNGSASTAVGIASNADRCNKIRE